MKKRYLIALVALFSGYDVMAQRNCGLWFNDVPLVADTAANIIYVTVEPCVNNALKGTLRWDESLYGGIEYNGAPLENGNANNLYVTDWSMSAVNTINVLNAEDRQWTLIFSTLPFVLIDCPLDDMSANYSIMKGDENHVRKYPGYMSVIDARCRTKLKDSDMEGMACFNSDIRIRLRGATTGNKAKKSFNVELFKDGETQDVHLLGYRKDDDWILASEYVDYSRMRNRVLMDLWNSVDDLPYPKDNKYQCNGTQGEFVEVFVNGAYYGLMCFTDKIDRKKLNLKKNREATETTPEVKRGLLWKANWESAETYLSGYTDRPENNSLLWPYIESKDSYGWEQKYPDDTVSQAFFDPVCDLIDLLGAGRAEFSANYLSKLYEQNVIDFILFIQVFQLLDNQKKNYYLSVRNYEKEEKFLFTLWDLDGSMGRYAGGDETGTDPKLMAWGEKLGYHNMIHRFKTNPLRPDDFATKMNNRWQYLSTHQLSLENVRAVMERYADLFSTSGAWERERARWLSTYRNSKKIAVTPQDEVEFMMSFLKENYSVFDREMASSAWKHDAYDEEKYINEINPAAIYVIGNDIISTHEDNTVTLQGSVDRELVEGITDIQFSDVEMTVAREGEKRRYVIDEIKEVRTRHTGIYPVPAFIPDSLKQFFEFDTHYAPVRSSNYIDQFTTFNVQRSVEVVFDGLKASVRGNLEGIEASVEGATVSFVTELEGLSFFVSGSSDKGIIVIDSKYPCKLASTDGGAMLSGVTANCDLIIDTPFTLNFYNDAFDGKCISTSGDVTVENGCLYFLMTGSGTLTDADFINNPYLGARAVMADNITVNGGKIFIKTIGHNGAAGLAAVRKITINGGGSHIATYDDPIKAGISVTVNGGFTFASSLTNDGLDSKGDLFVNGGTISTYSPEGAEAAFDVNHFYCDGGTVIGIGYKSDQPLADKSSQAALCLKKSRGVKRFVKITDSDGEEVAMLETPAYETLSIVYSSALIKKGCTFTILTGDDPESLQVLTTVSVQD